MESLCYSANKESEDAYGVSTSLTLSRFCAAGICLGTIQARTHVQLALAYQQSMIRAQHRLRLTMQHVYGHSGNLGSECADHAA